MTEQVQNQEPKKLSKKEQRIANAKQIEFDYADADGPRGIYDLTFRAHVARVLEALGFENGLGFIDAGWDKRIGCGLEPLELIKLAYSGGLKVAVEHSATEVLEKGIANQEEARLEALRVKANGGGKSLNGPVRRQ